MCYNEGERAKQAASKAKSAASQNTLIPCVSACAKEPRKHECIPGGWRYPRESGPWDQREACTKLAAKGIRSIAFIGDSLARQAMNGLRMVLSGNYQLSEWDWGYKNTSDPRARVCDDAQIKLSYSFGLTEASFLTEADFESNDIVVWGVGRL